MKDENSANVEVALKQYVAKVKQFNWYLIDKMFICAIVYTFIIWKQK